MRGRGSAHGASGARASGRSFGGADWREGGLGMASPTSSGAGRRWPARAASGARRQLAQQRLVLVHRIGVAREGPVQRVRLALGEPESGELPAQGFVGVAVLADELFDALQLGSSAVEA